MVVGAGHCLTITNAIAWSRYQIALYVAFLIIYIGPSALAGLAAMIIVIPFQVCEQWEGVPLVTDA